MTRAALLTARLLDGTLTEAEAAELDALVSADPAAEAEHLTLLELEVELRGLRDDFDLAEPTLARIEAEQVERTATGVMDVITSGPAPAWAAKPAFPAPQRSRRWAAVAALAACTAALVVGVWVVPKGSPERPVAPEPQVFAKLAHKSGAVEVQTPAGDTIAVEEGAELPAGFTVRTGDDSLAVIELLHEQARVEIEPDSVVRFDADAPAANRPRLFLSAGQLTAAVTTRPADRPLVVGTPVTEVSARAATFVVSSAGPDSARVDITDGNVELVRAFAPKPVSVAAGGAAVVSPGFDRMDIERPPTVDRNPKRLLATAGIQDAAFAPGGAEVWVATAKLFGRWSANGALAETGYYPRKGNDGVARFSRDTRLLFTFRGERDDRVLVRTVPDGGEFAAVNVRPGDARLWAVAPDAAWYAAAEPRPNHKVVRVLDVASGEGRFSREFEDVVGCVTASPDGRTLAVGVSDLGRGANNKVVLVDAATGERLYALPTQKKGASALAYSADGRLLAVGFNGAVQVWDVRTRELVRAITGFERPVTCLGFTPDGSRVAAGTPDGRVWLWEVASGRQTQLIEVGGRGVRVIAFAPDGSQLLTVGAQVAVWDVAAPPPGEAQ